MVRFEDNILLHFLSLQSVCVFIYKFFWWIVIKPRDGLQREDRIKETEDEVRFGVVEDRMMESL